ncbi:MAG TPA: hypothetical protein VMF57_16900 [Solirubrobacteraceae bacterium]|nr:hypothetical protein [Solirubrobacteraceae bacterium]
MNMIAQMVKRCLPRPCLAAAPVTVVAVLLACTAPAVAANQIYWGNLNGDSISYANLDDSGGGGQLLNINDSSNTVNYPSEVALDPAANTIWWANDINNPISYVNLDGTGNGQLNVSGSSPLYPDGVAVDPAANKVYWTNHGANTIS